MRCLQFGQNLEELAHGVRPGHADILVLEHEEIARPRPGLFLPRSAQVQLGQSLLIGRMVALGLDDDDFPGARSHDKIRIVVDKAIDGETRSRDIAMPPPDFSAHFNGISAYFCIESGQKFQFYRRDSNTAYRDTTCNRAQYRSSLHLLAGFLLRTMNLCSTGQNRLKSGFLGGAVAFAHKTGSSGVVNGRTLAHNDIGIIQMPGGSYACIVSFISDSIRNESQMNECHSKLGRRVYDALTRWHH